MGAIAVTRSSNFGGVPSVLKLIDEAAAAFVGGGCWSKTYMLGVEMMSLMRIGIGLVKPDGGYPIEVVVTFHCIGGSGSKTPLRTILSRTSYDVLLGYC